MSVTDGVAKWSGAEGQLTSDSASDEVFQQTIHKAVFPLLLPKLPFEATHRYDTDKLVEIANSLQ